MSDKVVKAKDLRASVKYITIGGQRLKMVFSNYAYYLAEDIYDREYGRDVGFEKILADASAGKIRALLALTYATLKAGGDAIPYQNFRAFMEGFDLEDMQSISEDLIDGIAQTLPEANEKNA